MSNAEQTEARGGETLERYLDRLLPKSLDDVFRANREKGQIYASTPQELNARAGPVPIAACKARISRWYFISIRIGDQTRVFLCGNNERAHSSWITTTIMSIDRDAVLTRSGSVYRLVGEPSDQYDLPFLCAALNAWGVGQLFGVPDLFF